MTPADWDAVRLSLQVSAWSTVAIILPGLVCAWLLARGRFPGRVVLDALVHLPLVLPPVVVGYVLLVLLGRNGPLGGWLWTRFGIELAFTWRAAAIAAAVMGFPLFVRSARLAIELVDPRLEAAARTLGAGRLRTFLTVTLPLAAPGMASGLVLAFARALGEFGATITVAGNTAGATRTLPLAIHTAAQQPGGDAAATRLVLVAVGLSLVALALSELLVRRLRHRATGERR